MDRELHVARWWRPSGGHGPGTQWCRTFRKTLKLRLIRNQTCFCIYLSECIVFLICIIWKQLVFSASTPMDDILQVHVSIQQERVSSNPLIQRINTRTSPELEPLTRFSLADNSIISKRLLACDSARRVKNKQRKYFMTKFRWVVRKVLHRCFSNMMWY